MENYTELIYIQLLPYLYRFCSNCEIRGSVEILGSSKLHNCLLEYVAFCGPVKLRLQVNIVGEEIQLNDNLSFNIIRYKQKPASSELQVPSNNI